MIIETVDTALALPKGRLLSGGLQEVSLHDEETTTAAKFLLHHQVTHSFQTQAEVVEYAFNNLGWATLAWYAPLIAC